MTDLDQTIDHKELAQEIEQRYNELADFDSPYDSGARAWTRPDDFSRVYFHSTSNARRDFGYLQIDADGTLTFRPHKSKVEVCKRLQRELGYELSPHGYRLS